MNFTPNQLSYLKTLATSPKSVFLVTGPAGSGKTALACRHAAKLLTKKRVKKVIITKPAVSVDEEHGFLPGDLKMKMTPWLLPMLDALGENMEKTHIESLIANDVIEIAPIAYMRGRTFKNCFILADEMQNCTPIQMKMVMTRLGENSKMVITGDMDQHDRHMEGNGLFDFVSMLDGYDEQLNHIEQVVLERKDIMRHPAIQEILDVYG